MIEFNEYGNPQPPGILESSFAEFQSTFVENFNHSQTRRVIFDSYESYVNDFKSEVSSAFRNWIDGSYTTTKLDPNDINLVNIVAYSDELNQKDQIIAKFLTHGGSKERYSVDGYFIQVYPTDDPRYAITQHWLDYWLNWFGHDRQKRQKALIELSFV